MFNIVASVAALGPTNKSVPLGCIRIHPPTDARNVPATDSEFLPSKWMSFPKIVYSVAAIAASPNGLQLAVSFEYS
jgi:hypothetical protein